MSKGMHRGVVRSGLVMLFLSVCLGCSVTDHTSADGNNRSNTGELAFSVKWVGGPQDQSSSSAAKIYRNMEGVEQVYVEVFDSNGDQVADGGPWNYGAYGGTVDDIPVGDYYSLKLYGRDGSDNTLYEGVRSNITINENEVTQLGVIEANYVGPNNNGDVPPTVSGVTPGIDAVNVPVGTSIRVTFSEEIDSESINQDTFQVNSGTSDVQGEITYSDTTATFIPSDGLALATHYTVTLTTDILDVDRNGLENDYSWEFTTTSEEDTTPPFVVNVFPSEDSSEVSVETAIGANFSEALDVSSISSDNFVIKDGDENVPGNIRYSGTTVTFTPDGSLNYNTEYTAVLTTGLKDLSNNHLTDDFIWLFTTEMTAITIQFQTITFDKLPDTGQTDSYTDTFGEDSDYTIYPQSYTKLGDNGEILPSTADNWIMVKDNVTGLIWEVKQHDGSIHDADTTYNWVDAQDAFVNALNSQSFGGFDDWRIPSIKELSTIVFGDAYDPASKDEYFPNIVSDFYWSSTYSLEPEEHAWGVGFYDGSVYNNAKSDTFYVRAVRGGE